jgi:hypothetical protein
MIIFFIKISEGEAMKDVRMRYRRPIFGKCYNDADYPVRYTEGGVNYRCPYYMRWYGMITRCYSEKFHRIYPAYVGCSVCDDWLYFSKFKAWMELQDWEGKQIDKDLLIEGNKVYSPNACIFVSEALNKSLVTRKLHRGLYPLGVTKDKKAYSPSLSGVRLGNEPTPYAAHRKWQSAKVKSLQDLRSQQDNDLVLEGIDRIILKIETDIENNRITETL